MTDFSISDLENIILQINISMKRKSKFVHSHTLSPVQLMKEFYCDYTKTNKSKKKVMNSFLYNERCKTDSAQKITQFLTRNRTNSEISPS